jgi:hypothetical protein
MGLSLSVARRNDHRKTNKSLVEEAETAGSTRQEYLDSYQDPNNVRCMHGLCNHGHKYEGAPALSDPPQIQA